MEVNPSDGQIYQVQSFERNRFELHPQNPAPYNILLGLLGQQFKQVPLSPELNNRATPLGLVNSLYNALNLQDYQRAYNYWLSPTGEQKNPRSLADFSKGYEQTASVGVATGSIISNGTAGTVYYAVPTVIIADQKDGSQQRYYGCYQIARIDVQIGDKPLPNPLYISFAKVNLATSNNDETNLLKQAQQLVSSQNLCAY